MGRQNTEYRHIVNASTLAVIEMSTRYNITETDKEFQKLLDEKLETFERDLEKNLFTQEATLELLSLGVNLTTELKFPSSRVIWNAACFVNIISYDLKLIVRSIMRSKREWEKRLFARQAALLIYETTNDLFDLLGKDFKSIVGNLSDKEYFETELKNLRILLNQFKEQNSQQLKNIRNVAIAHRGQDTLEQLQVIYSISLTEAINFSSAFDKILNTLGPILEKLTGKVKEMEKL